MKKNKILKVKVTFSEDTSERFTEAILNLYDKHKDKIAS